MTKTMRRASFAAAATASLAVPAAAWAHGTIRPSLAAPGSTQTFTIVVPVTAQSPPVTGFSVSAPAGVRLLSAASAPPRWSATIRGSTVTWRGGPIPPGSFDSFGFKARLPATTGTISFSAHEVFADGTAPTFSLNVVLFSGAGGTASADDEGTRTLALFALVLAIVAVVLAAAALVVSLARWLRG